MTDEELIAVIRTQTPAGHLTPVATPSVVAAVEAEVGHPMPPFLRRLLPTTFTSVREYFAEGVAGRLDGPSPLDSQLVREPCGH
ncbi:hypothetical protein ACF1AY_05685 [Streptomyces sp. NPDC014776]|uniref:hypothetical protein n=1 Tax=Streptomyces sp. NPDC014776 TaxID=3364909 RepID=UPI003700577A